MAACNGRVRTLTIPELRYCTNRSFSNGVTAALRRIKYRPTKETVSDEFPFLLTTGRVLEQFNAGTMTMRTPNRRTAADRSSYGLKVRFDEAVDRRR